MTRTTFRRLIIFWWLLGFVGIIVTLSTNKYLPAELSGYLETKGTAEMSQFEITALIIEFLLLFALILSSAGLYFFKSWSRDAFLVTHLLCFFLTPFSGPTVMSEWAAAIAYIYLIVNGGLLFALYLPPLNDLFPKNVESND